MSPSLRLLYGSILSTVVALLAHRRGALSASGVAGAILTGTLTLGFGGWSWGLSLIAFFLSSTLLTRWQRGRKAQLEDRFAKGGQRDLGQALANGGAASLLALLGAIAPHPVWPAAFAGALAAATADTWATEIGVLSPNPPRLITTGRPVAPGTSGGVTLWGTAAGAAGSLFLGLVYTLLSGAESALLGDGWPGAGVIPAALVGGLAGSVADSLLGATLQAGYRCPQCGQTTERRQHCGQPTLQVHGWRWLGNDAVNLVATLVGATLSSGVYLLLHM